MAGKIRRMKRPTMSILTVGGTGAVGSEFTRTLARQGYEVRALVRGGLSHPKSKQLLDAGVQIVEGDLCRHDTIGRAVRSVETVICSATSMPSADNDGLRTVDRDGTLALIRTAELEGVKRFVYVSYSGNIRQDSPLENAKRDCEDSLKNSSME